MVYLGENINAMLVNSECRSWYSRVNDHFGIRVNDHFVVSLGYRRKGSLHGSRSACNLHQTNQTPECA